MLKRLSISNLAIIENVDVSFEDGFTVLTGETGAGKSLLIDSLALLLGERASSELIRQGEEKATIRGVFEIDNKKLAAILAKMDVPTSEEITIERTISKSKNAIRLNGVLISLSDLQSISRYFADIHSQFDFAKILNPENYLGIIDGFSPSLIEQYKNEYTLAYSEYKKAKAELFSLKEKQRKIEENRDFYEYQLNELKAMGLKEGEEEDIESELSLLKNHDKIYSLQEEAKEIINGSFMDDFYNLSRLIGKLSSLQSQYEEEGKVIDERYYEISDLLSSIKKKFADADYDPNRLDELEQRQSDLSSLKRKYHKDISELISYRDELSSMVGKDSDVSSELISKEKEVEEKLSVAFEKGDELSQVRKKVSKSIEKDLERSLFDLLLNAKFSISYANRPSNDDSFLYENGIDTVDFLIETNVGEGMKSLSKTISGGEASRIMLAFKTLFIKANKIPTVIFDEIDTGISGETSLAVAAKIREISHSCQVIAITHTPQVASYSDHHMLISKEVRGDRTFSSIRTLSFEEKIRQIAYLISGEKITKKQLEYAEEMVLAKRD